MAFNHGHGSMIPVPLPPQTSQWEGMTGRRMTQPPHSDSDNSIPGSPSVSPVDATPASPLLCSPPLHARHGLILSSSSLLFFRTPGFWAFCSPEALCPQASLLPISLPILPLICFLYHPPVVYFILFFDEFFPFLFLVPLLPWYIVN